MLLLLTAIIPAPGYAQEPVENAAPEVRVLTLDDCINIAFEKNIGIQRTELGIELSAIDRIRNEAYFDPGFQLGLTGQGSNGSGSGGSTDKYNLNASYTKPFFNGSSWVFSAGQGRSSGEVTSGEISTHVTSYSSQIGLSFNFPLMEGQGVRVNRIGIERSDLGITRSEIALNEARRNLRYQVMQAYVQAVTALKQIEVMNVSLGTAQNLVDEVTARINVGQLAPYELLAAQAGLAERQESLINAQSNYKTLLDNLKEVIGLPLTDLIDVDPSILAPVYLETDPDELYLIAQRNRGDLRDLDLRVQLAQLDLLLAEDKRQQSLIWTTSLGLAGIGDDYSGSISDMNGLSWQTGLQYKMQLGGNRRDEADYNTALIALEQLDLEKVDFLRGMQLDIRTAQESLHNAILRIDVTLQGLDVQEVKMENEKLRLELGLITSKDLLQFDLDLANARLAYDNAMADALNAIARLEFLTGQQLLDDAVVLSSISNGSESNDQ